MNKTNPVKLWLDDLRPAPPGWQSATTANAAIEILEQGRVAELSLDHDLGEPCSAVGNGYQVAVWLEEQTHLDNWAVIPRTITIHSANPVGRANIQAAIDAVERLRHRG